MKIFFVLMLAFLPLAARAVNEAESRRREVEAVFRELRSLSAMKPGQPYTLPAGGAEISGSADDFLRRRTVDEIVASGLSCGCGDYALVFADRITRRGYEALVIDSAQISFHSLVNKFDGHVVVAIRPRAADRAPNAAENPWWLIDTTALNYLSFDWSPEEKNFVASGTAYWIGFCGPVETYAAKIRSPAELRKFYAETLGQVPAAFLNRHLYRFEFTIDDSFLDEQGRPLNPRVSNLTRQQAEVLATYGVVPEKVVPIVLKRGGDDASGNLDFVPGQGCVSRVGLRSACSASFLTYMETRIRQRESGEKL